MKALLKGVLLTAMMFAFAAGAGAEEAETDPCKTTEENISFNYENNVLTVKDDNSVDAEKELTVMLVKGDYSDSSISLANIVTADVYYIGQASGKNYSEIFKNIGVKYDGLAPGEYTMLTSGDDMTAKRTKVVIGNVVGSDGTKTNLHPKLSQTNLHFGEVTQTLRIVENEGDSEYIYVCVSEFPVDINSDLSTLGFHLQRISGINVEKAYKSLADLGLESLNNINSAVGTLEIGIQLNKVANGTEIVAIPYYYGTEQEG